METKLSELLNIFPKQQEALAKLLDPQYKYVLYGGAVGGGKSYLLRWGALTLSLFYASKYGKQGIPVGLFSEDYPTLKDRQVAKIKREFPPWMGELKSTQDEGYCFFVNPEYGGGRILLRNLDDPSKYMSSEFAAIFVEELTKNPEQTFYDLRNRLRYPGIEDVKFFGATNPGGVGHGWVKKFFIDMNSGDPEQKRFVYIHANVYDNPHLDPDYVKQLEGLPENDRKALLEGSWDVFQDQFFDIFSRQKHVCLPFTPKPELEKIGSFDWGYTSPFCFLGHCIEKLKSSGGTPYNRVITYAEVYDTKKAPQEIAREIMKTVNLDEYSAIYADTQIFDLTDDGGSSIAFRMQQVWGKNGYKLKPANKNRISGWGVVRDWFTMCSDGFPYWMVTSNCKNLIRTLPSQVRDKHKPEDIDSAGEDHAVDTLRYGLVQIKYTRVDRDTFKTFDPSNIPDFRPIDISKFETVINKNLNNPHIDLL